MISKSIFVDTNIWVYATNPNSPFFAAAQNKLSKLQTQNYDFFKYANNKRIHPSFDFGGQFYLLGNS